MSANPPKRDAWRPYRDTRFVLVRSAGKLKPCRGLILEWRRTGPADRRWEAQVIFYDDGRAAAGGADRLAHPAAADPRADLPELGRRRIGGVTKSN